MFSEGFQGHNQRLAVNGDMAPILPFHPNLRRCGSIFSRRRIFPPVLVGPALCLLCPPLLYLAHGIFAKLSGGFPVLCAGFAVALILYMHALVKSYAPNAEKRDEALQACWEYGRLPLVAIGLSGILCSYIVRPISLAIFPEKLFMSLELDSWLLKLCALGATMALGLSVLGLSVLWRFLGWLSIDRCSSVPLQTNPIDTVAASVVAAFSSPDAFIDMIAGPDPQSLSSSELKGRPGPARSAAAWDDQCRYKRPPLIRCMAQIAIHAAAGAAFGRIFVTMFLSAPLAPLSTAMQCRIFLVETCCAIAATLALVFTVLSDGKSHEIEFGNNGSRMNGGENGLHRSHLASAVADVAVATLFRALFDFQRYGLLPYLILTPLLCRLLLGWLSEYGSWLDYDEDLRGGISASQLLFVLCTSLSAYLATALVFGYLMLTVTLARSCLVTPGIDTDKLVWSASSSFWGSLFESGGNSVPFVPEDLIVQSLLSGCCEGQGAGMVRDLVAPFSPVGNGRPYPQNCDLEKEETKRNDVAIVKIADGILSPLRRDGGSVPLFQPQLEGDILRAVILDSFGGVNNEEDGANVRVSPPKLENVRRTLGMSVQHFLTLRRRFMMSDESSLLVPNSQPILVPIIRALSCYAGGMGEAFLRMSSTVDNKGHRRQAPATWSVPRGATSSSAISVRAAARFIVLSLVLPPERGASGNRPRHGWISMLIPSVLHSAFRLRCGVVKRAYYLQSRSNGEALTNERIGDTIDDALGAFISANCSDLRSVLTACDDAALWIMRTLRDIDGTRDVKVNVVKPCQTWLEKLL